MNVKEKFQELSRQLNEMLVERENQVEGALAALLSGQHVLLLGPPGTGKSLLAKGIYSAIKSTSYFKYLLTAFSTPEEVFGPYSLSAMQAGEYKRVTMRRLPEAHIAFLDEIFKANSAILNSLLTVLNEREFDDNGVTSKVPLLSCIGASNELPRGEELGALYDRFMLRFWVKRVQDRDNRKKMVQKNLRSKVDIEINLQELIEAQAEIRKVEFPDEVWEAFLDIDQDCLAQGCAPSDRAEVIAPDILRAFAWLRGNDAVTMDELETLADMIWKHPDDRKKILEIVTPKTNPLNRKALEYTDMAEEVYQTALKNPEDLSKGYQAASKQLKRMLAEVADLLRDRPAAKVKKLSAVKDRIAAMHKDCYERGMA